MKNRYGSLDRLSSGEDTDLFDYYINALDGHSG